MRAAIKYRALTRLGWLLLTGATLLAACGGHDIAAVPAPAPAAPAAPTVASVNISGDDLTLAPSSSGAFTAHAMDAAGNPLSPVITWMSSDPTIATVAEGKVTAVAVGQAQITATANGVVSAPRNVFVNPSQTTEKAVAAAVASGEITAEQALIYEVLSVFNDPGVPGKFRATSDQQKNPHDLLLEQAAAQFESLSRPAQDVIGPYLVPPAYWQTSDVQTSSTRASSAVSARVRAQMSGARRAIAPDNGRRPAYCFLGVNGANWVSVDSTHFRVWYNKFLRPAQSTGATAISADAEAAYKALVGDGGFRAPLQDDAWGCDGGDGRLDIYIMPNDLGEGTEGQTIGLSSTITGGTAAVFIELSPSVIGASDQTAAVTHEFMHAIQHAYQNLGRPNYFWTADATAVWAEDFVSQGDPDPPYYAQFFVNAANFPLFYPNQYCSGCGNGSDKIYGAYLFFQFMTRAYGPTIVSQFFQNSASSTDANDDPLNEIDYVLLLTGQGGLTQQWSQFALALWNQAPVPVDPLWDGADAWNLNRSYTHYVVAGDLPMVTPAPTGSNLGQAAAIMVDELSEVIDQYDFSPDVHSVVFYNGFSTRMISKDFEVVADVTAASKPTLDGGNTYAMVDPTTDEIKGRHIWALKKINGNWLPPEDWTGLPYQPICLDSNAQRVESLVLIFSNGNFTSSRSDDFDNGAIDAIGTEKAQLVASKTPCWQYKGTINAALNFDDGTDKFSVTTAVSVTFNGQPIDGAAQLSAGHAIVFYGWAFDADPLAISMTASLQGTINSCGAGYKANGTNNFGIEFWNAPPRFVSLVLPPAQSYDSYFTASETSLQYTLQNCGAPGVTKRLPSLNPINFNLDFSAFQHADLVNGLIKADSKPSPAWAGGGYSDAAVSQYGTVTNTWCLFALTQGATPPTGKCP